MDISALKEDAGEDRPAGSAKQELADMIGLSGVKEVLNKAIASHKLKKLCLERGIQKGKSGNCKDDSRAAFRGNHEGRSNPANRKVR